ncbi:hypothetical protein D3C75_158870 [compost metagenome]
MKKIAKVKFPNEAKLYDFFIAEDVAKAGEPVVCDTARGYSVGVIKSISDVKDNYNGRATKWVVCKVDLQAHMERVQREEHARSIRAQLEAKQRQFEAQRMYNIMAQEDPEVAEMLAQLKVLEG